MSRLVIVAASIALFGCGGGSSQTDAASADDASPAVDAATIIMDGGAQADATSALTLPTGNARFDYQLGGAYTPPAGIQIVARDRSASPAAGLYNICYVNGFQTQPDERDFWLTMHPDLLLRDGGGDLVIDPVWDEIILDVRTPAKRKALAAIVGGWIGGCAGAGFHAVEIDNLDTYARSGGLISQNQAVAFMASLSSIAHANGIAIAQKNSAELLARQADMNTDFAVVEECNRYDECGDFQAVYGDLVLVIEYRQVDFDRGCADFAELSIVLRDLDLVTPADGGYVFDDC